MPDMELPLESLLSRISQLEERQNVVSKYMVGLKRQFDGMSEELQQIEPLKEQVAQLQQRFNQLPTLDNADTTDASTKSETIDDAEVVRRFFERVEQSEKAIAPPVIPHFSKSVVDRAEVAVNADAATQQSDEEFKIERMLLLLRAYTDEEESQEAAISRGEFLRRIQVGERNFTEINLAGANLSKISTQTKNSSYVLYLNRANLKCTDISESWLRGIYLYSANLENSYLHKAYLESAYLCQATLKKANLSRVNLKGADLREANLSQANFSRANLRNTKLMNANLSNANLNNANLLKANLEEANLQGVKLQQALYNIATIFPPGFDPIKEGAYLIAPSESLQKANLMAADLSQVNLTNANLEQANLIQGNLQSANLTAANLYGANLSQGNLLYANFSGADMRDVNLTIANCTEANLSAANLTGAKLCGTNLQGTKLNRANLTLADLREANLSGANLEKANLKDANLSGANLGNVKLTGAIMPDGTTHE